ESRLNELAKYLIGNPDATNEYGENITDVIVSNSVKEAIASCFSKEVLDDDYNRLRREFDFDDFSKNHSDMNRGLERDGFSVEGGELRRMLPEALDLPKADNEVHKTASRIPIHHPARPPGPGW
ncbi:MAG: hypothetical protein H0X25_19315, partial [Acidobacteriales bacterium]|nr:hypothetical protein [Terriglobales bacterium]